MKNFYLIVSIVFLMMSFSHAENIDCQNPKKIKEKISCSIKNIKKSKTAKKFNEINEKKTLADLFKKKD